MNRQEKEEYFVTNCDKYDFRKNTKGFRDDVFKFSDYILDLKIEILNELIEDRNEENNLNK